MPGNAVCADEQYLDGACGINNINGFIFRDKDLLKDRKKHYWEYDARLDLETFTKKDLDQGGPVAFASFADTKECKRAYEILCTRFLKLYQSDLIPNKYHGPKHRFFICLFDLRKPAP